MRLKTLRMRMRRITWRMRMGKSFPHIWNRWPRITYSMSNLYGCKINYWVIHQSICVRKIPSALNETVNLLPRSFSATTFLTNVNSRSRSLCCRPSVCLSVCLSATLVHPTQAVVIFGNIYMAFGTLAIHWHPPKILRRSSQGNPSVEGIRHNRGSQI